MNVCRAVAAGVSVALAAGCAAPVAACLNDRDSDSLAAEGGKLPHVVQVITGRFERNPPLFYQLRRDRVAREIARGPRNWNLYDDAAVASDRLHEEDAALGWIEKKRAAMERAGVTVKTPDGKEAWYRYHANAGTFWAHRYLQAGAKKERVGEMRTAIRHIEKALVLKPNAHFGRERYQLAAMKWIAHLKEDEAATKGDLGGGWYPLRSDATDAEKTKAVEGLTGLIVLGNAWESVDVFTALSRSLAGQRNSKVAYLAALRAEELFRGGRRSLDPRVNVKTIKESYKQADQWRGVTNEANLRDKYAALRAEADRWQAARTVYLTAGLTAGRHPDTDPAFWNGFQSAPPPALDIPWQHEYRDNFENWRMRNLPLVGFVFLLALVLGPVGLFYAGRRLMQYRRTRGPETSRHSSLPSGR